MDTGKMHQNNLLNKSKVYLKSFKPFLLPSIVFAVLIDIFLIDKSTDGIIFGILLLYLFVVFIYKFKSLYTFIICLILLVIMYLGFLITGTSVLTEKAAVWIYLFLFVGIIQQWREISKSTSMDTKTTFSEKAKTAVAPIFIFKNWWTFYLDYFNFLNRKPLKYKLYNGTNFHAKANDADGLIINEVWGNKIYSPSGFEIKPTDTVVDIGAHKGYFSVYAAKQAKAGKVISFEPTEKNYSFLTRNIKLNKCTNVNAFNLGIAAKKGERKIYEYSNQSGGISLIKDWFKDADKNKVKSFKIKCITFDDIFKTAKIDKIDYLKIDCEGAEHEILLNASSAAMKKVNKIGMEYHEIGDLRAENLIEFLKKHKFTVKRIKLQTSIGLLYAKRS